MTPDILIMMWVMLLKVKHWKELRNRNGNYICKFLKDLRNAFSAEHLGEFNLNTLSGNALE